MEPKQYREDLVTLSAALFGWVVLSGIIAVLVDPLLGPTASNAMFAVCFASVLGLGFEGLRFIGLSHADEVAVASRWRRIGLLDLAVLGLSTILVFAFIERLG